MQDEDILMVERGPPRFKLRRSFLESGLKYPRTIEVIDILIYKAPKELTIKSREINEIYNL